jgi:hypothetical protein
VIPVRIALNVVYAMLTEKLDGEQRQEFDARLYGFDEEEKQANLRFSKMLRGGEDE